MQKRHLKLQADYEASNVELEKAKRVWEVVEWELRGSQAQLGRTNAFLLAMEAQFKNAAAALMACFFAITTPAGVGVGTALARQYNYRSSRALVVEGVLDSVSAGILIYMALVDLIAADFLSRRMSCNFRMQVASYVALFLGAASMSSLAIWA